MKRCIVTILILLFVLYAVAATGYVARAGNARTIVYVVTDSYDRLYLASLLKRYPQLEGGLVEGLDSLALALDGMDSPSTLLVLVDPNYEKVEMARHVASKVYNFIVRGGIVVATFNGVTLLELDPRLRLVVEIRLSEVAPCIPGYNVSKYGYFVATAANIKVKIIDGVRVYSLKLGRGWLVLIPLNLVWAYVDTRNNQYLDILSTIIKSFVDVGAGGGARPSSERIVVAGTIASVASLVVSVEYARTPPRSSAERAGRVEATRTTALTPLYTRLQSEELLSHPIRARIMELLEREGILHFNEIWRRLGVAKATIAWHLSILKRFGIIGEVRIKGKLFFYPTRNKLRALIALAARERIVCSILCSIESMKSIRDVARTLRVDEREIEQLLALACITTSHSLSPLPDREILEQLGCRC